MGKDVWDRLKGEAVADFLNKKNLDLVMAYDPDIIDGKQPYAGLLSGLLSMRNKIVQVTTIPSTDVDLDKYEGKRVLVINDDPLDKETPVETLDKFGHSLHNLADFRYAVGNPLRMFTYKELEDKYGSHGNDEPDDG